jgi:hypothetical protein
MNLAKLVKNSEKKSEKKIEKEGRAELARRFGVEPYLRSSLSYILEDICSLFGRNGHERLVDCSNYLTKQQIAQVLLDNGVVSSLDQGLEEVPDLVKQRLGDATFQPHVDDENGVMRYRLELPVMPIEAFSMGYFYGWY